MHHMIRKIVQCMFTEWLSLDNISYFDIDEQALERAERVVHGEMVVQLLHQQQLLKKKKQNIRF